MFTNQLLCSIRNDPVLGRYANRSSAGLLKLSVASLGLQTVSG
jgi:hypothetical protein